MSYTDVRLLLKAEVLSNGRAKAVTRHTILGRLHQYKEEEWQKYTQECELRGEEVPLSVEDFLVWASKLKTREVRKAIGALQRDVGLRLHELIKFWRIVNKGKLPF